MKRFWTAVDVEREGGGWTVMLDGRPVRTPARNGLIVPSEPLADAIAQEWRAVDGDIDPRTMPLTGLANAAVDRVGPDPQAFAAGIARYAEADLVCYRAEEPRELAARQDEGWDPLLAWARRRYDLEFAITCGIVHVAQPRATIERLGHAVAELDPSRLAGLAPLVTLGGSLVAALAVIEGAVTVEEAWNAVSVDERWQLEQWGADKEAIVAFENRKRDFLVAARFLPLLDRSDQ